ncbi:MAG TPA: ABC transporter ATP-binding protein [Terriglobia bacterium]|nr:ABC transporter ATP-binding protein [Terriglobia bacterium]
MDAPPECIVELHDVSKRYGEHAALENFSLEVRRGEFLTLLGPSGSGKTTLLRLVAGFEMPQEGRILINGRDASTLPPYHRNVNTVFQHYALFPHLTVFRNVAFGLEQKHLGPDVIRTRVRAILEVVELPGKEDRYPHQLSGGEKQRVALARALVLEPAVLLLDEPLGALDQKLRQQMQVELKRLRARLGITFIFVTHDQEEALVMSDRVAVINHGRLEQVGAGEEIYERPRTHFVADFMGVENFFEVNCAAHTAEGTRFELEDGKELWASNSAGLPVRSPAMLAVRPECIRLTRHPPARNGGPVNLLKGELIESIYEGGRRRWAVQVSSGQRVVVRDANASRESPVNGDKKVYISWDAARSLVYPRNGSRQK